MNDSKDEIDDILRRILGFENSLRYEDKLKQAIADFIKHEVIGEDERQLDPESIMEAEDSISYERIAYWNKLRAEQRARIDALLASNEGEQ